MENKLYRDITTLRNWDVNPRAIKKDKFEELKKRMQRFGQIKPIVVMPDGEVLGGNMRLRAMKEIGVTKVWVSEVEPKTEAEKIEIALTDNEEFGYYIDQQVAELVAKYKDDIDLAKYSIHLKEPETLAEILQRFSPEPVEDEVPAVEDVAVSKLGEVYELGRHRVMCGDSTKIEDVTKLMDGKKADMVFTDPPYNMAYIGSATKRREKIQNDSMDNFEVFITDATTTMVAFAKVSAPFYMFTSEEEIPTIKQAYRNCGLKPHQTLIWKKNRMGFGGSDYQHTYEPFVYGWTGHKERYMINQRNLSDVWEFARPSASDLHPTMKPISLIVYAIANSSKQDDIVLDTFLGSGSTLIACEQTNRICYGMELDPKYVDVIRKRYWKFTHENSEEGWDEGTKVTA